MKTRIIIVMMMVGLILSACKMPQINIVKPDITKDEAVDLLTFEAAYQLGKWAAKQLPEEIPTILKYCGDLNKQADPLAFQTYLDTGKEWLLKKLGDTKHYQRQLDRVLPKIEVVPGETPTPAWMESLKPLVEEFVFGIQDAQESLEVS